MADDKKLEYENITPEEFEFVQRGEKIFDKKFETKPIGYFKDAMIRFTKNRANVTASIILFTIILSSIFIPIFSPKNAETQESRLQYLPPRMPVFENWGIWDGTKFLDKQPVDPTTIDPETGLGIPADFDPDYIDMDTLDNYPSICSDKDDDRCLGGYNRLSVDNEKEHVYIQSGNYLDPTVDKSVAATITDYTYISLNATQNAELVVTINEVKLTDGAHINIYVKASIFAGEYFATPIATIDAAGTFTFSPYDIVGSNLIRSTLLIEMVTNDSTDYVDFTSIEVFDDTSEEAIYSVSGFEMSNAFKLAGSVVVGDPLPDGEEPESDPTFGGKWSRVNGTVLVASFEYDAYAKAFGTYNEVLAQSLFNVIIEDNPDTCVVNWTNPDNPNNWTYAEGCPIEEVNGKVGVVIVAGQEYFSYDIDANYGLMNGYEEIPYFVFGTSGSGKDLFKLIWIGTRTSLLLGLLVSAINISVGIVYGAISGYYGGTTDLLMQRFAEIVGRIPWLVTLSIFIAWYGPGQTALLGVMIISGWIGVAGVTRTQFYRYKGREYVLASRTLGAGDGRLIFRHILPNGIGTIITSSILSIPYVIFTESTLSFLGFGIGHGTTLHLFGFELSGVSIGVLLADGRNYLLYEPYLTLWPALVISILMISFNMFGNALRDAFNPALRGSE